MQYVNFSIEFLIANLVFSGSVKGWWDQSNQVM